MDEKFYEMAERLSTATIEAGINHIRMSVQSRPEHFVGQCTCGEDVPQARIDAGYYNWVDCQSTKERQGKQHGT